MVYITLPALEDRTKLHVLRKDGATQRDPHEGASPVVRKTAETFARRARRKVRCTGGLECENSIEHSSVLSTHMPRVGDENPVSCYSGLRCEFDGSFLWKGSIWCFESYV